jgi:hypothetical protein
MPDPNTPPTPIAGDAPETTGRHGTCPGTVDLADMAPTVDVPVVDVAPAEPVVP